MAASSKPENARVCKPLTPERLREVLAYDPLTGIFTWKMRTSNRISVGDAAGTQVQCKRSVYIFIGIDEVNYAAHRLAWMYVYGEEPAHQVDHKDTNGLNNAISNLRDATSIQNKINARRRVDNTSGFKGVSKHSVSGRWRAVIQRNGSQFHLGFFDDAKEAHEAYVRAAKELYGEFARAG